MLDAMAIAVQAAVQQQRKQPVKEVPAQHVEKRDEFDSFVFERQKQTPLFPEPEIRKKPQQQICLL